MRDDLQRFIVLNWGHSERAVTASKVDCETMNNEVSSWADSVSRDQAYEIAKEMNNGTFCFLRSVDPSIRKSRALDSTRGKRR